MVKILLADDEKVIRELTQAILSDYFPTYPSESFPNGDSLLNRLEQDVSEVALVITDNHMYPGLTGSEIIKKYAKTPRFEKIPFILAYGGDKSIGEESVKDGAFEFLIKPFGILDFVGVIRRALNNSS